MSKFHRSFELVAILSIQSVAESWIRVNHLGWHPDGPQKASILSEQDLSGKSWSLLGQNRNVVATGTLPASLSGNSPQNPLPYGVVLSFGIRDSGVYRLVVPGADTATIKVARGGYGFLAQQALRHLRLMRSGPEQFLFRNPGHLGDSEAPVRIPAKNWESGTWTRDPSRRAVDMVGGWYDAGDQIKFTLTIAYTTYFLLRAWEENPGIQAKWLSPDDFPDILDEAKFGLSYLEKCLVDDTTFVIQIGDSRDHQQPSRLPENDKLEGIRPALSALSPVQIGYTSAALALGARIFKERGDKEQARRWLATARKLHTIATRQNASRKTAYWKDNVNDLYRDESPYDNLALMGAELFRTTGETKYLEKARAWSDSAGKPWRASWMEVGITADLILSGKHPAAKQNASDALRDGAKWTTENAGLWGYPENPIWCPLQNWTAYGAEALVAKRTISDTTAANSAWDILDYVLGRNPWGVSFFMSRNIPHTVSNIYNPLYFLNDQFPTGAIAEGPGSGGLHRQLSGFFHLRDGDPIARFNTDSVVFFDDRTDFMTMETVIGQQATFLYLLAAITRDVGETTPGRVPPEVAREPTVGAKP